MKEAGHDKLGKIPTWDYGTISSDNEPPTTASSSGFLLKEQGVMAVVQPEVLQNYLFPISEILQEKILSYRDQINRLVCSSTTLNNNLESGENKEEFHKLLIITGPSSLKNPVQSRYCSQWLSKLSGIRKFSVTNSQETIAGDMVPFTYESLLGIYSTSTNGEDHGNVSSTLLLSMRANATEYDPSMYPVYSSKEVHIGIPIYRTWLHELAKNCPITVNLSNTISPQYIADLCCLGVCAPSFLESQLHRELVSGCSYPCGFMTKNYKPSELAKVKEAMFASAANHSFLTVTKNGSVAQVETSGNSDTFAVVPVDILAYHALSIIKFQREDKNIDNIIGDYLASELLKIVNEMSVSEHRLKLLFDVGRLNPYNFEVTQRICQIAIENKQIYDHLLGFMIESGEHYLPNGCSLKEENPVDYSNKDTYQFNNLRTEFMSKDESVDNSKPLYYALILADQLIHSIDKFLIDCKRKMA